MFGKRRSKNDIKKLLSNYNFEMASQILIKKFTGAVIPKELLSILSDFVDNPCVNTANRLIEFDSYFLSVFELAQKGGFTERNFKSFTE